MTPKHPKLIGPWRARLQWSVFLLWLSIPLVRPGGIGLLRLDLPHLALEVAGRRLPVEDLYLLLLLALALLLLFLFLTLALGRVWCGWGCPQTALVDLAEAIARRLGLRVSAGRMEGTPGQHLLLHLFYLALALLCGTSLVCYFVPPAELLQRFIAGNPGWPVALTLALCTVTLYLDLALLRRLFCREFCPYGRFQAVLIDAGTLTLRFHPSEAHRCIRCGACVKACPVGIDIRNGEQVECINCGRCLDACRRVMYQRNEGGIIRYTFGIHDQGPRALVNARLLLVGAAALVAAGAFLIASWQRPDASLKFGRSAAEARPLADGNSAVFYNVYLHNRSSMAIHARLEARLRDSSAPLPLLGPVEHLTLEPGAHRRLDFAIVLSADLPAAATFDLLLRADEGRIVATAAGILPDLALVSTNPSSPAPEK